MKSLMRVVQLSLFGVLVLCSTSVYAQFTGGSGYGFSSESFSGDLNMWCGAPFRGGVSNPTAPEITPNIELLADDTLCLAEGDTATLVADSLNTVYTWSPGADVSSTGNHIARVFPTTSKYIYVSIADGSCGQADSIFIKIIPPPTPDAFTDHITLNEDTTNAFIDVQANDTIEQGFSFTTSLVAGSNHVGNATVVNGDSIRYTPPADFNGIDTILYQICFNTIRCDTDTVYVTVNPINDAPVAQTDRVTIPEDATNQVIDVQDNDSDVDGDNLTTSIVDAPNNGTVNSILNNDSISYSPNPNFFGNDTLTYRVCDPSGACDTDTVIITITAIDDAPIANTDRVTIPEDTTDVFIDVQANDSDPDGGTLTTGISIPTPISTTGTFVLINNDSLRYTPPADFFGMDTILYRICDATARCDTDTVIVTVVNVNDPPVAQTDYASFKKDTINAVVDVQDNDSDADGDELTTTIIQNPTSGTADTLNGDSIVYTPLADFFGVDTLLYKVCDLSGACDTDTVFISVGFPNRPPDAMDDIVTYPEDTTNVIIDVQDNDIDLDGDDLTTEIIEAPTSGGTAVVTGEDITYNPPSNFFGNDTIVYRICDDSSACDTALVVITITSVNDVPVAVEDFITVTEDTTNAVIDVQDNDSDVEGDPLTTSIVEAPRNGTANILNGDSISYTPNAQHFGADTIVYRICDASDCDDDTVFIQVTAVNDVPIANTDRITIPEDTSGVNIDVQANDIEHDNEDLTTSIVEGPVTSSAGGSARVINTDSIQYDPPANFFGMDTIWYRVCDAQNTCDTDTVIITVTPINDAPIAQTDYVAIPADTNNVAIDVQDNDTEVENEPMLTTIVSGPSSGGASTVDTLNGDSIVYTPAPGFTGYDTILYRVCDPHSACDTDSVIIAVGIINVPPIARDDSVTVGEPDAMDIDVQDNDYDFGPLTTGIVDSAEHGDITVLPNGQIRYAPDTGYCGKDTIIYRVCDFESPSLYDTATVYIDVVPKDSDGDGIADITEGTGDTDLDQIPNFIDLDSDNDGIPDAVEGPLPGGDVCTTPVVDTDGDNIPDYLDLDSDNDGIVDVVEAGGVDTIPDGKVDDQVDNNADGIDDTRNIDNPLDTDQDGIPDFRDLDTDNDGIVDVVEGGNDDTDSNGIVDNFTDFNGDGLDDNNPISDPLDTDGDTLADFRDLDTDNDGIVDVVEGGNDDTNGDGLVDNFEDNNGDGLDDNQPIYDPLDTDADSIPDFRDLDTDNDGIADVIEGSPDSEDTDQDGKVDDFTDSNNDGLDDNHPVYDPVDTDADSIPDFRDLDTDNDGITDVVEGSPTGEDNNNDGRVDDFTDNNDDGIDDNHPVFDPADTDSDSIPDFRDLDTDNDRIPDVIEGSDDGEDADEDGRIDNFTDDNNDGLDDNSPVFDPLDTDADSLPDFRDLDTDNDRIPDIIEGGTDGEDNDQDGRVDDFTDNNGDGLDDDPPFSDPVDTDSDSIPDFRDLDTDNDRIPDVIEGGNDGEDDDQDGRVDDFTDSNDDGLDDDPPFSDPVDTDNDQVPDFRDLDTDNDLIPDVIEGGNDGKDDDQDGRVDDFTDNNGDGLDDNPPFSDPVDTDSNLVPDFRDLDTDGDGIPDIIEGSNDGKDDDQDRMVDDFTDSDGDGMDDDGIVNDPVDTDDDGTPDWRDPDSDNDGINDGDEYDLNNDNVPDDCDSDGIPDFRDADKCEKIDIPEAFSPNGDGVNDEWIIDRIDNFPGHRVIIFNRWGNEVYDNEKDGELVPFESWDGTNTTSLSAGDGKVPESTYFYVIDLNDGSDKITGFIFLLR